MRHATAALCTALGLLAPLEAAAYCQAHTNDGPQATPGQCSNQGLPLTWSSRCVSLSADPTVVPDNITAARFEQELVAAGDRWNQAQCNGQPASFQYQVFAPCVAEAGYFTSARNDNRVAFAGVWGTDAYHTPEIIALTITTFNAATGELRDADTDINLRTAQNPDGYLFTVENPVGIEVDLPTVLTHEIGHSLGLAHSADRAAVMWYTAGLGEQRRTLQPDDLAGLCAMYPPGRSATCDPQPPRGFVCAPGCGCAMPGRSGQRGVAALACVLGLSLSARRYARARRRR